MKGATTVQSNLIPGPIPRCVLLKETWLRFNLCFTNTNVSLVTFHTASPAVSHQVLHTPSYNPHKFGNGDIFKSFKLMASSTGIWKLNKVRACSTVQKMNQVTKPISLLLHLDPATLNFTSNLDTNNIITLTVYAPYKTGLFYLQKKKKKCNSQS